MVVITVLGLVLQMHPGTAAPPPYVEMVSDAIVDDSLGPAAFTEFAGLVYFSADDGAHGEELWVTDGRRRGSRLFLDLLDGLPSSQPWGFTVAGDKMFFTAHDSFPENSRELWVTDGTEAGTRRVADIQPGPFGSSPGDLTPLGSRVIFSADDGVHGRELWVSDGTESGTQMVGGDGFFSSGGGPLELTLLGDQVVFSADDGLHGRELWASDGTADGTAMVTDAIALGELAPSDLVAVDTRVFFVGGDTDVGTQELGYGRELWVSDGTPAGTHIVRDIAPGADRSSPAHLTPVGDTLFFTADDGTDGHQLWRSDGTAMGTVMVTDRDWPLFSLLSLTSFGGSVYFTAESSDLLDPDRHTELWRSDGTASGTSIVRSFRPGDDVSVHMTPAGDHLYFTVADDVHGGELWLTDGTDAGTSIVADIAHGPEGSDPRSLQAIGRHLYFGADDGIHGPEVWISGFRGDDGR